MKARKIPHFVRNDSISEAFGWIDGAGFAHATNPFQLTKVVVIPNEVRNLYL